MTTHIYVIYGQGGIITSFGMKLLANRIQKQWPTAVVTTHDWYDPRLLAADIVKSNLTKTILIGYSLGANCVTWIGQDYLGPIDLAVCYDPSRLSIVTQPGPNIKRLLLYHNTDIEPEGHAIFTGQQVERTEISMPHLAICYSSALHDKTMEAIGKVMG